MNDLEQRKKVLWINWGKVENIKKAEKARKAEIFEKNKWIRCPVCNHEYAELIGSCPRCNIEQELKF